MAWCVAAAFCVANLLSYNRMLEYPALHDGFVYFGRPFSMYAEGGFVSVEVVLWTGLIGSIAVALCVYRIASKILERRQHRKPPPN